jgi:hypothetical protein
MTNARVRIAKESTRTILSCSRFVRAFFRHAAAGALRSRCLLHNTYKFNPAPAMAVSNTGMRIKSRCRYLDHPAAKAAIPPRRNPAFAAPTVKTQTASTAASMKAPQPCLTGRSRNGSCTQFDLSFVVIGIGRTECRYLTINFSLLYFFQVNSNTGPKWEACRRDFGSRGPSE